MHWHNAQYKRGGVEDTTPGTRRGEGSHIQAFSAYGYPLDMMTSFKYLGQVILASDNDFPAVVRNLAKVQAL